MSNEGKYVLSKNKSAGKRTFMMGRRGSFVDERPKRVQSKYLINIAPGPGSYRLPSDFGQYDELNHSQTR